MTMALLIIIVLCLLLGGDVVFGLLLLAGMAIAAVVVVIFGALYLTSIGAWPLVGTALLVGAMLWGVGVVCEYYGKHPQQPKDPDHPWDG